MRAAFGVAGAVASIAGYDTLAHVSAHRKQLHDQSVVAAYRVLRSWDTEQVSDPDTAPALNACVRDASACMRRTQYHAVLCTAELATCIDSHGLRPKLSSSTRNAIEEFDQAAVGVVGFDSRTVRHKMAWGAMGALAAQAVYALGTWIQRRRSESRCKDSPSLVSGSPPGPFTGLFNGRNGMAATYRSLETDLNQADADGFMKLYDVLEPDAKLHVRTKLVDRLIEFTSPGSGYPNAVHSTATLYTVLVRLAPALYNNENATDREKAQKLLDHLSLLVKPELRGASHLPPQIVVGAIMFTHALHVLGLTIPGIVSTTVDCHPSLSDASEHVLAPLLSIWAGKKETFVSALALVGNSQFVSPNTRRALIQHGLDNDWFDELGQALRYPYTQHPVVVALLGEGEAGLDILTRALDGLTDHTQYLEFIAKFNPERIAGLLAHWRAVGKIQDADEVERLQHAATEHNKPKLRVAGLPPGFELIYDGATVGISHAYPTDSGIEKIILQDGAFTVVWFDGENERRTRPATPIQIARFKQDLQEAAASHAHSDLDRFVTLLSIPF